MSRVDADVIVVGAGPAGAFTALLLARAGVDVLLLDRAVFPRAKPCGDCLSAGTGALLSRHDLLAPVHALPHAMLDGWRIFSPGGAHFSACFADSPAIAIEREVFDHCLVAAACTAGARLLEGVRVTDVCSADSGHIRTGTRKAGLPGVTIADLGSSGGPGPARSLTARFVVGADGLRSIVARRLGAIRRRPRVRKFSLTMHIDGALPFDAHGEMHMGIGLCVGVAPLTHDRSRWNVTVVGDARRFGRAAAEDQLAFVKSALGGVPGIGNRIPGRLLEDALPAVLASGPFDVPAQQISFAGAALVGDAAGYFDPFTGQGVYQGMRAAELLAAELIACLEHPAPSPLLRAYPVRAGALTRSARRLQHVIDAVLARPALADAAIGRLARATGAAQTLLNVTGDTQPVRTLLAPGVALQFLFPGRRPAS